MCCVGELCSYCAALLLLSLGTAFPYLVCTSPMFVSELVPFLLRSPERKIETLTHSYCRALSSEGKLAKAKSTLVVATCLYPDEAPIFFELWRVCCISDDFKHAAR